MTGQLPLVGLIEVAQHAGVRRNTVTSWRQRYPDFPEPVAELAVGPVFWWPEVKDWLVRTGRAHEAGWTRGQTRLDREMPWQPKEPNGADS